ncbi:cytochrome c [Cellvibrio sp. KY-GH-1]|uniref:cytochrome c n=1 Tax=Cellvibrio sp. KY-GH-1 TaxID=2303332 RepID=UPI00178213CD|nr:cytochrome c [Cellvibrio sp. KY-GH-1]
MPFAHQLRASVIALAYFSFPAMVFADTNSPALAFKDTAEWTTAAAVSAVGNKLQINAAANGDILVLSRAGNNSSGNSSANNAHLVTKAYLSDALIHLEYLVPEGSKARLFLHGRYAIDLPNKNNEWSQLSVQFRAPRFDEARNKTQNSLLLEARINGDPVAINQIMDSVSPGASMSWEDQGGPTTILVEQGQLALRNFTILPADFGQIILPEKSGGETNQKDLVDFVALGKETFESVGCNACHLISKNDAGVSTGPNLYALFKREVRDRAVVEGGEGHRFTIKANREYLHRSLRDPSSQLAIAESGAKKGEAFLPIMPAFSAQTLSDVQIDAIGAYLSTLNEPFEQGPAVKLLAQSGAAEYDPIADRLQLLVDDEVRIQRGPMAGVSGRAIHVGTPWGINYSFDPRLLAITKIWQGGFLDMSGEFLNRGGKGLKMGYESREINFGNNEFLLAPLNAQGKVIDFSFKDAKFGDPETAKASLYSKEDHLPRVAAMDAQFLGYTRNSKQKQELPTFNYRVGKNTLKVQTRINANGEVAIHLSGEIKVAQQFSLNPQLLQNAAVDKGEIANNQWILPAGSKQATLTARMQVAANAWHAKKSTFNYRKQPIKITESKADLPAGYRIESYYPPKDNYGREQLFEALGLALTPNNTTVIATRTAGIWRMVKGEWQLFAEGTFDSLGLLVEDKKGLQVIAGQKAELTRIKDTNGDGIADTYETLFDAHSYHGNYHSYMHGPVRGGDGAYYISINLADGNDGSTYKADGKYMGSAGGLAGWNIRVKPNGKFTPWANGLRSPAGLGTAPDGRIWYSDNQGEFMGTSKIFVIEQNKFYGHPSSLVDLPGMTPDSPEIAWSKVQNTRTQPIILLPHNRVANSPGNPAWDTTKGKFGPFTHQMLMGDQTQSNLLRIAVQNVDGVEQGSVMPFIDGLESGVMRPLFLKDGSLLLGQTGRGWQAKGGHVASLQRIIWDGKNIAPAIIELQATTTGFAIEFTQPIDSKITADELRSLLTLESWVYRDAPDYGSDELDVKPEAVKNISIAADRKSIRIDLATLEQAKIHPQQTARIYHAQIKTTTLFEKNAVEKMDAYYTLYKFPKE